MYMLLRLFVFWFRVLNTAESMVNIGLVKHILAPVSYFAVCAMEMISLFDVAPLFVLVLCWVFVFIVCFLLQLFAGLQC